MIGNSMTLIRRQIASSIPEMVGLSSSLHDVRSSYAPAVVFCLWM